MTHRGERVARGSLAATVAVFVAALFHSAAGGPVPSMLAVTLSLAFSVPVCAVLAGRRMTLWRLTASVILSQVAFHLLFGLGTSTDTFAGAGGHIHPGMHITLVSGASFQGTPEMTGTSWPMWLGHVSAALVTIVVLRYGETSAREAASALAIRGVRIAGRLGLGALLASVTATAPDAAPRLAAAAAPIALPAARRAVRRLPHRGPPRTLSFA